MSTYDVKLWSIRPNNNKARPSSYSVRWFVAGRAFSKTFKTKALAEGFQSKLSIASREGVAFDESTGLPEHMARRLKSRSWYAHAVEFVDMKWPHSSAMHRRSIAESLATVTPVLVTDQRGRPEDDELRAALYAWAFNKSRREARAVPSEVAEVLRWVTGNSVGLADLVQDPALLHRALDTPALRRDGTAAAPTTVARKRAVLSGCLKYAVELGRLDSHPLDRISWRPPKGSDEVDRQVVVNPVQARALLTAVGKIAPDFTAFFGCMYYSALRPEEALHLTDEQIQLPTEAGCWGWLQLDGATVVPGPEWTDDGNRSEDRGLKHRARNATRRVPVPPPLVELLRCHVDTYRVGLTDRLFVNRRGPGGRYLPTVGRPLSSSAYGRVWHKASEGALSEVQQRGPLAKAPYHLRHAAVSLWLNAGVPAPQVAEWAGHTVNVLMRIYAKCVDGQDEAARRRIEAALGVA